MTAPERCLVPGCVRLARIQDHGFCYWCARQGEAIARKLWRTMTDAGRRGPGAIDDYRAARAEVARVLSRSGTTVS